MEQSVLFTDEAKRLIELESKRLAFELEEEALRVALRSRGEPVEVTASDVRKASMRFVKRDPQLRSGMSFLLKVYFLVGILMFIGGIFYPYLISLYESYQAAGRISFMISMAGLVLAGFSVIFNFYLQSRTRVRMRYEELFDDDDWGKKNEPDVRVKRNRL